MQTFVDRHVGYICSYKDTNSCLNSYKHTNTIISSYKSTNRRNCTLFRIRRLLHSGFKLTTARFRNIPVFKGAVSASIPTTISPVPVEFFREYHKALLVEIIVDPFLQLFHWPVVW